MKHPHALHRIATRVLGCIILLAPAALAADDREAPEIDPVIQQLLSVADVGDPLVSPHGRYVAYTVTRHEPAKDENVANIWLTDLTNRENRQLTFSQQSASQLAWHPVRNAIAFLSDRHDTDKGEAQLWLLPLGGGEAQRLTDIEGGVQDYTFSPDGSRIAVVVQDPDPFELPDEDATITTPPPIVIDRFHFKEDEKGYLTRGQKIYLLDGESGTGEALALAGFEPSSPAFSPDGRTLAYVAKRGDEPDRTDDWDVHLLDLSNQTKARAIAPSPMNDCGPGLIARPRWSPDSGSILCVSAHSDRDNLYAQRMVKRIDVKTGVASLLTEALDRQSEHPRFAPDGKRVYFTFEDDMTVQLASVPVGGGEIVRELQGNFTVAGYGLGTDGSIVARIGRIDQPWELYTVKAGRPVSLTSHNDDLLAEQPWQDAEAISFEAPDGTEVHGLLVRPAGAKKGRRYPTVLWIHGGPTSQFSYAPRLEPQLFAAHGYAVLLLNPRGSTGRGIDYSRGIYAAWGSVDVDDVLAGVDFAVEQGIADPDRLVVGGWSYGGMLTNYVIASDTRFKAAVSGASIANVSGGFGTDQYIRDYLSELGAPWDNPEAWSRVSYPFLKANRIETPTLFLVGEKDYNVPLLSTEQMYQALKVLRVPTQMVIYPGQPHSIGVPSYNADRWQRYLDWFERYL